MRNDTLRKLQILERRILHIAKTGNLRWFELRQSGEVLRMKSVLISISPKWCEKIANGEKTIEVRKSRPKIETPFKCYIYETKGKQVEHCDGCDVTYYGRGKVIGEFVCDKVEVLFNTNGNPENYMTDILPTVLKKTALSFKEFQNYVGSRADKNNIYGWHISDLRIYDKPKELSEFVRHCRKDEPCIFCEHLKEYGCENWTFERLTRPPQSWCYVEVKE